MLVAPLTLAVLVALLLTALLQPVTELVCRRAPRAAGALAGLLVPLAVLVLPGLLLWQVVAAQAAHLPGQLERGWSRTPRWR